MTRTDQVLHTAVLPAMALLPPSMNSAAAQVLLLAIGLQESKLIYRRQVNGPARGLWQFEKGGGVHGVLNHPKSRPYALSVCTARDVLPTDDGVYAKLDKDDVLAAAFARLLLFTDPDPLPAVGQSSAAWDYYLQTWRPGRPHPQTWSGYYAAAEATLAHH